jgi:MYXO-CTERM domain-containing protein
MDAGAEWSDFEAQASALDNTSTQDCATACKALESLSRAAQHICEVAPDECESAKAKLKTASDRVHAACPSCEVRAGTTAGAPNTHAEEHTLTVQSAPEHGGCAGCAMSSRGDAAAGASLSLLLLAGIGWRRRRRNDLRRVRDALRVEPNAD